MCAGSWAETCMQLPRRTDVELYWRQEVSVKSLTTLRTAGTMHCYQDPWRWRRVIVHQEKHWHA